MLNPAPTFIDAFAGCGGLSLGLLRAGWRGLFAVEKDPSAFATYKANLLTRFADQYVWPEELPTEPMTIDGLLDGRPEFVDSLKGKVTLIAGGPPCQGFSSAGRRIADDPRNKLVQRYLDLVAAVEPTMVLLENVKGLTQGFSDINNEEIQNYSEYLVGALSERYTVFWTYVNSAEYGVPQARTRFILVAVRKPAAMPPALVRDAIDEAQRAHLRRLKLVVPVGAAAAISDLEISRGGSDESSETKGFREIRYLEPRTHFQRLMRDGQTTAPTDVRLPNHRPDIQSRFAELIQKCHAGGRLNVSIGKELREEYGLKKQALRVLDPDRPAPTITSMPDDLLHYSEPRTLTVRENARLQSFPDWFAFQGKYTTGGKRRRYEVPRYTQVANAVPPYLAQVLGEALRSVLQSLKLDIIDDRDIREVVSMLNELAP